MEIYKDYDLKPLNTFGIPARAKFFAEVKSEEDLSALFALPEFKHSEKLFLGGGSNILFTKDFGGIVILNKLKGIEILEESSSENVIISAMSGEIWHDLVVFAAKRGLWGIENLALIPGTVGAAPMQNIGAYGAELRDVLLNVEAYSIESGEKKIFKNSDCEFDYRDSIFKNRLKGQYFISAITLNLSKAPKPNLSYKLLREYLEKTTGSETSPAELHPKDISEAVVFIRKSKLPDPNVIPNAGSFFKNIFVSENKLKELLEIYPGMPYFIEEEAIKIPSGWLIEQCGPADRTSWKGYRAGNAGVHEKQALVLVNYGGASGEEIKNLAGEIIESVKAKFGLTLVPEVNLI